MMLCSDVAAVGSYNLGGVALVDVASMAPPAEVPIALESALGGAADAEPGGFERKNGRPWFYCMPGRRSSTLYVYEAQPESMFQYGDGPIRGLCCVPELCEDIRFFSR